MIGSTVIDYKISLHGLSEDSDDYRRVLSEVHLRSAKIILQLCDANKGFYTKAGQFVAALPQVPKEYSSTLSSLQDQAVPCQFKDIKKVLTSNLGPDLSKIFLSFDELPIAAASIAQVHHAVLKDHQEVAVKVQYPGLEHQLKVDIAAMSLLSKFVAWAYSAKDSSSKHLCTRHVPTSYGSIITKHATSNKKLIPAQHLSHTCPTTAFIQMAKMESLGENL